MNKDDILVCITNYNCKDNSLKLKEDFSKYFETIIIDSDSPDKSDEYDIIIKNEFYTGLFNESVKQTKNRGKKYLFFIASDVYYYDVDKTVELIEGLSDDVYLWAPSSKGQSHQHCKNFGSGKLREVPYLEGFTFLTHIDCCDKLYPVSIDKNIYGYGIDLLLGYFCVKVLRKFCVVDDRIEVYHKEGTGYDGGKALRDMYNWMANYFGPGVLEYTKLYASVPGYLKLLEFLKL
jgi:hypothetical protein